MTIRSVGTTTALTNKIPHTKNEEIFFHGSKPYVIIDVSVREVELAIQGSQVSNVKPDHEFREQSKPS